MTQLLEVPSRRASYEKQKSTFNSEDIKGGWDSGGIRTLCKWKKSLWKHIWKELVVYTVVYLVISLIYRYAFSGSKELQEHFERIVKHFKDNLKILSTPLTFILGLYIGLVVKRWWDQYTSLPWPDDLALHLRACITAREDKTDKDGKDDDIEKKKEFDKKVERALMYRRTIIRYCLVSYILAIRRQSSRFRKRFEKIDQVKLTGLLTQEEMDELQEKDYNEMYTSRWWVPIDWCMEKLVDAEQEKLVVNAPAYSSLVTQVRAFKQGLQKVKAYGNLPVPLVYSQVVTLAVYVYFGVALIGDQYLINDPVDMVYPFFLTVRFMFYYGLLSVATSIYNPWGVDEEDFELNKLLARHWKVSMAIVDDTKKAPEMREEKFNPTMLDNFDPVGVKVGVKYKSDDEVSISASERIDPGKNASNV